MRAIIPALTRDRATVRGAVEAVAQAGLTPWVVWQAEPGAGATTDLTRGLEEVGLGRVHEEFGGAVDVHLRPLGKGGAVHAALKWWQALDPGDDPFAVVDADLTAVNVEALHDASALARDGFHARLTYDSVGRVGAVLADALDALGVRWPRHAGPGFLTSNVQAYPGGYLRHLLDLPRGYGWDGGAAILLDQLGVVSIPVAAGERHNLHGDRDHIRRVLLDNLTAALEGDPSWSESAVSVTT